MEEKNLKNLIKKEIVPYLIGIRNDIEQSSKNTFIFGDKEINVTAEKGQDGITPVKDVDYLSLEKTEEFIKANLPKKGKDYWTQEDILLLAQEASKFVKNGKDGKDVDYSIVNNSIEENSKAIKELIKQKNAEIVANFETFVNKIAEDLKSNIELKDIIPYLESKTGKDRLDAKAIKGLEKYMQTFIATSSGGGGGGSSVSTDTLQSVTDRGATTTVESTFSSGIKTNQISANSSAGISIKNLTGDTVALLGAGDGLGTTLYGGTNIAGSLTVDTNTFFVDSVNNRIGIGTITPAYDIDFIRDLSSDGYCVASFGANNTTNSVKLGTVRLTGANYPAIWLAQTTPTVTNYAFLYALGTIFNTPSGTPISFRVNNSNKMVIDSSGNVCIGTTSGNALLDVRGSAIFNEDGADKDFRIEGDTDSNNFFLDASADTIFMGTTSLPSALKAKLAVRLTHDGSTNYEASIDAMNDVLLTQNRTGNFQYGLNFIVQKRGNYNFGSQRGVVTIPYQYGTGTTTNTMGVLSYAPSFRGAGADGSVTHGYVFYAGSPTQISGALGTVGTTYGLYIEEMKKSFVTKGYGIYQNGTSDINYFEGKIGYNTTAPDRCLEINTGATTCGIRLTYNDNNGSAVNYVDMLINSSGDALFSATGGDFDFNDDFITTTGRGLFGNDYKAYLGLDASAIAGYFTNAVNSNGAEIASGNGAGYFYDGTGHHVHLANDIYAIDTTGLINTDTAFVVGGAQGYTGDLNDSNNNKIADVVGGIITATYY